MSEPVVEGEEPEHFAEVEVGKILISGLEGAREACRLYAGGDPEELLEAASTVAAKVAALVLHAIIEDDPDAWFETHQAEQLSSKR